MQTGIGDSSQHVIEVNDLRKSYGNRKVIDGLGLHITAGETYALLGPNGCGKTTTIEMLEGFRRPDGGEIRVLGQTPLNAPRSWRAAIGIVAQQTGDLGPYSPRELIAHFGRFYPNPRPVDEVLAMVGLESQARIRASKLSGGQQRRLDVALGVVGRPKLLFLDEPTTGFDPEARRKFWTMLKGLSQAGTAILLTTHYLDEAAHLANRVGVMVGGRIAAEAPPGELGGSEARIPVVQWRDKNGKLRIERTVEPAAKVAGLLSKFDGEPPELEVKRPSLEDIYLDLIGTDALASEASEPLSDTRAGSPKLVGDSGEFATEVRTASASEASE